MLASTRVCRGEEAQQALPPGGQIWLLRQLRVRLKDYIEPPKSDGVAVA